MSGSRRAAPADCFGPSGRKGTYRSRPKPGKPRKGTDRKPRFAASIPRDAHHPVGGRTRASARRAQPGSTILGVSPDLAERCEACRSRLSISSLSRSACFMVNSTARAKRKLTRRAATIAVKRKSIRGTTFQVVQAPLPGLSRLLLFVKFTS
jgi:hypothetical protein